MGMQTSQIQSPQTNRPMGKGGLSQGLLNGTTPGNIGNNNSGNVDVPMRMPAVDIQPDFAPIVRPDQVREDMMAASGGINGRPQQATQGLGKGSFNSSTPFAQGGNVTYPGQGGQPQMGKPNTYSNTVGPWDNASIQPRTQSGKGKGY